MLLFLAAVCLERGLRGLAALGGLAILFTGYFGQVILWGFYAEPMLLFGLAVVVLQLAKTDAPGENLPALVLSLGALAWVKQEGLVLALLIGGFLWLRAGQWEIGRARLIKFFAIALGIWFVPWRVFVFLGKAGDENFSLGRIFESGNRDRLSQAWTKYGELLWDKGEFFAGAWWLLPLVCYVAFVQGGQLAFLLGAVSLVYLAVVVFAMTGSVQADFDWHLYAATRVLLLPSFLLLLGFGTEAASKDI